MSKNCEVSPFEGLNRTAQQIEFINKKTGKYFFLSTPINDKEIPSFIVERACLMLGVELPKEY